MLAMNLLMTGNLTALDPYALETWGNELLIAIDQDPLGYPAILLLNEAADSSVAVRVAIGTTPPGRHGVKGRSTRERVGGSQRAAPIAVVVRRLALELLLICAFAMCAFLLLVVGFFACVACAVDRICQPARHGSRVRW
jgi:hypothetical protein